MKRLAQYVFALVLACSASPGYSDAPRPEGTILAPALKWQRGGCTSSCQTGWYASPAVADLDNDGQMEVVWGASDVVSIDGNLGTVEWRAPSASRVWPGIVIADLTGDGTLEVVVGRNANTLTVYQSNGSVLWTRNPFSGGEVRTLAVADLENDGLLEIVVGRASSGGSLQVSVYEPDGTVRAGFPARRVGEPGVGAGMYNQNVTVADVDANGVREIIAPTDTHYITALDRNGNQLPVNPIYGAGEVWSQAGVHVDHAADIVGFANCGVEHRPNFANCAPVTADVDGDGSLELVIPGDVYDCAIGDNIDGDLYVMPWILELDRTRWSGSGFDWTVLPTPVPNSGPLSEDFTVIENNVHNAVAADLDSDGRKELLFPSYDGRLHAIWLDKTEHGNWPFDVPGTGIRFAGEPAVVDIDNDGQAEVVFTSWPQKATPALGRLHVLDSLGNELHAVDLPTSLPAGTWNGGLAAPTIANIDADADREILVGTAHSGVVAYDLPNSANARVLWATGRGSLRRTGVSATGSDSPGVFVTATSRWFLRYANSAGPAVLSFGYGSAGSNMLPIAGDFTGNGFSSPGLYNPETGSFLLRHANSAGVATRNFSFGNGGADILPVVGDWNGDGIDTIGIYNRTTGKFLLRNRNSGGAADLSFTFGNGGLRLPIAGDWNGDGVDTIGLYDPSTRTFFLKNSNGGGVADRMFTFGPQNASPLVGDWNGDAIDTIGVYVQATRKWFLRNSNSAGLADLDFSYGPTGATPLVGNWDGA